MDRYLDFEAEDFIDDPDFRDWVFRPSPGLDRFWREWLAAFPHKAPAVERARILLTAFRGEELPLSERQENTNIDRILDRMAGDEPRSNLRPLPVRRLLAAAAVVLVTGLAAALFLRTRRPIVPETARDTRTARAASLFREVVNSGLKTRLVSLSDGSSVLLRPGSRLHFAEKFTGRRREVYLTGEAFFEVARDASRPFFVHAGGLTARVVGTSFRIRSYAKDRDVLVSVKTGQVAVFPQTTGATAADNRPEGGLLLTPHRQATFDRGESRLRETRAETRQPSGFLIEEQPFMFRHTPLVEVFDSLEKAYGIDLVYEAETLENCTLTASLGDEPLPEKIRLICAGLELSYEMQDGQILISGQGCR
ncbi:FecR family protein [Larkinella soli]|uniref:FecR family protein n=1 Tax=Larkinella soli TaxID=1770527 RepID=UPI000FFB3C13|nr:FecR family protein [Larkinella soli]